VKARSMARDRDEEDDDLVDTSASTKTGRKSSESGRATGGMVRGGGLLGRASTN